MDTIIHNWEAGMFRLYSKGCEYTLRALAEIAAVSPLRRFRAAEVCEAAGIPEAYTRKTFQALVQAGFLTAIPGPGGGYTLTGDPARVTVRQVVEAVDGFRNYDICALGHPQCSETDSCPMHELWIKIKENMRSRLDTKTVADLGRAVRLARSKKATRKK